MARKPLAPAPAVTVKFSTVPLQLKALKDELFLPSSQVSICRDETMGTPRAWAEATTSFEIEEKA
jgi:hypothetical protein